MPARAGGAFYGRRKGKGLRAGQEGRLATLLPRLRVPAVGPVDPAVLFPGAESTALEIGFGGGEHLSALSRSNPRQGFVGCEPFVNGLAKMLATIEAERLGNVRLWDGDAAVLLPRLRAACLDRVFLLYPDPWPKRRQRKRRLVSDAFLSTLARVVKPGGAFRFATDIDDYAGWTLARVLRSPDWRWTAVRPDGWRRPWPGWPGTRYESKALREGRTPIYLTFERTGKPNASE
jgi:tRNA (guanine-N7-)-methyltransferase